MGLDLRIRLPVEDSVRLNILTMAASGIAIAVVGLLIYFFRKSLYDFMPFILALPPIGVAAYVYLFRLLSQKTAAKDSGYSLSFPDIMLGGLLTGLAFIFFCLLIMALVSLLKKLVS